MQNEEDLLKGPIVPTLVKFSIPIMMVSFAQMAYNLTDIFFVGQIGVQAVAATGTMGYFLWVAESLIHMPQLGVRVLSAQHYGAGERKTVTQVVASGFQVSLLLGILFGFVLYFFCNPLIAIFNLEPEVVRLARQYSQVIAFSMPFGFSAPIVSAAFNSIGDSKTPFRINIIGIIANVIFNSIFIFGLGPFPQLGVAGAALGTTLAKMVVCGLLFFAASKHEALLKYVRWFQLNDWSLIRRITRIGLPSAAQSLVHVFISMFLNRIVAGFGSVAVAVYSTGSQFESLSWLTSEGFSYGLTAFIGQNFGAKLKDRIQEGVHKGLLIITGIGIFSTIILIGFRYQLFPIFIPNDPQALKLGAAYLLILGYSQLLMCVEIGATGIFQGFGQTMIPSSVGIIFNALRIPLALILPIYLGLNGIWWALTISSLIKGSLNYVLLKYYMYRSVYPQMELTD